MMFRLEKRNILISILIVVAGFAISMAIFSFGYAQSGPPHGGEIDIEFPIAELGGCESESDCMEYCNSPGNLNSCIDFGLEHGLMTLEEAEDARRLGELVIEEGGPGGCTSRDECELYCEDVANIEECLLFAEEHDMIPEDEIEEARRISRALAGGAELPGGCTSKDSCELYCEDGAHIDECLAFSEAAGFMSPQELDEARRVAPLIRSGETPGGCTSKDQCENYCEDEANFDECIAFAEKAGFLSEEEREIIKKTGGKGPGGCRSRESCEAFCKNPDNQQQCFEFAKEHGLISEGEIHNMQEGIEKFKNALNEAPPEVRVCIEDSLGPNVISNILDGSAFPNEDMGQVVSSCFDGHFGGREDEHRGEGGGFVGFTNQWPPEIGSCLKERAPDDLLAIEQGGRPSHEFEDVIDGCFQEFGSQSFDLEDHKDFNEFEDLGGFDGRGDDFEHGEFNVDPSGVRFDGGEHDGVPSTFIPPIDSFPLEVRECVEHKIGSNIGESDAPFVIEECIRSSFSSPAEFGGNDGFIPEHIPTFPEDIPDTHDILPNGIPSIENFDTHEDFESLEGFLPPSNGSSIDFDDSDHQSGFSLFFANVITIMNGLVGN